MGAGHFEMLEEILLNVGEDFHNTVDYVPVSHSKHLVKHESYIVYP